MSYLGLDVGTTRCKACVFDDKGRVLSSAAREYGFSNPFPGWAEQDSEMVWSLVKEIVREAVFHATQEPRALAISAQGEAVIFVDSKGKILRPTILGMDMRAVEECEILSRQFGAEELLHLSGVPLHPITSLSKIFWVKRHQPEIFKLTEKFLLYEDFIFWKLGGLPVTDYSMACKTMLFDIDTQEWSGHLLDFLEITPEQLAVCCPSGTVIGTVRKPVADELGLPPDLKLVMGGHDQCCAPLGAGSIQEGVASDNMGTAEIFSVPVDDHSVAQKIEPHNFSCYSHVLPHKYLLATLNQTGGLLLRWYRDQFGQEAWEEETKTGRNSYEILLSQARREPAHIFVLPHWVGSGTPYIDAFSKGAIVGMTLHTDKGEIIRAICEAVVFEQLISIELFEKQGIHFHEIRAVGGCSRSSFWLQIRADILGKPVKNLDYEDGSVMGAAMLAAVGDGAYSSFRQATEGMIRVKSTCDPDLVRYDFYRERFAIYRDIYFALKDVNRRIK